MAKQIEDVKILNIDEVPYAVDAMSETVQAMVGVFNNWNQKDADTSEDLAMIHAAKNDLSRRIILQVRKEKEESEAAEAANAEGTDDSAPTLEADTGE